MTLEVIAVALLALLPLALMWLEDRKVHGEVRAWNEGYDAGIDQGLHEAESKLVGRPVPIRIHRELQ